jgi:hypothetical protein
MGVSFLFDGALPVALEYEIEERRAATTDRLEGAGIDQFGFVP